MALLEVMIVVTAAATEHVVATWVADRIDTAVSKIGEKTGVRLVRVRRVEIHYAHGHRIEYHPATYWHVHPIPDVEHLALDDMDEPAIIREPWT